MEHPNFLKLIFLLFLGFFSAKAQDTLTLSREQSEARFLKENLLLIAEELKISQSEALVIQARKWPNPTIEIDEINLWATQKQLGVFGDELQGFNGENFGRNQQLALSIEQLIQTAGKRKKLVALEQVAVEQSKQYLEELLRNLKIEFRNQMTTLQYLQSSRSIYQNQRRSIRQLTQAYQKQVEQGNVPQGEYIRLKALELEILKNLNELENEINEAQKELKLLMRLPADTNLEITEENAQNNLAQWQQLTVSELIDKAKNHRPDYKLAKLEESYFSHLYDYEKAQRSPDLTLSAGYDRGGNFMYNFVGFGLSMDLPFFNRNQGNIKHAKIGQEYAQLQQQQTEITIENEILLSYQQLTNAVAFLEEIEEGYDRTLDTLLASYTRSFSERNLSLLEYLDFVDAYLENKKIILDADKEVKERTEELNYTLGMDLIR
jgi:cobalt-zinc-cadmium efflux system outer membrane protein